MTDIKDKHYHDAVIEPLKMMCFMFNRDEFRGFLKGNIIKYSLRAPYKGQESEDRRKTEFYLDLLDTIEGYPDKPLIDCLKIFKENNGLD